MEPLRTQFPILQRKVGNNPLIYFDNAATTQKPQAVIDSITDYYTNYNSNVHRGVHTLSEKATNKYIEAHKKVANYINAEEEEVFFTSGATEGLNFIANRLGQNVLEEGDVIVVTEMEHHSNIIPWQLLVKRKKIKLEWLPITDGDYSLDLEYLDFLVRKYREKLKVISFVNLSNVLGVHSDVEKIVEMAKSVGALTVLDCAQAMMHGSVDVKKYGVDFAVFSGHKMFAPTGIGVFYGRKEMLEEFEPWKGGGEMVEKVWKTGADWAEIPWKFEAGTPNIAGGIGLGKAIDWINENVSWKAVEKKEKGLMDTLLTGLKEIPGINIFGPESPKDREGMVAFTTSGMHPHDLASLLDEKGVAIRAGYHCAEPLHKKLESGPTSRVSMAFYNTKGEVNDFLRILEDASGTFK